MTAEDGSVRSLSGYSISFGGGMANSCVAIEGAPVIEFSTTKCGDFIDRQAAEMTGNPVGIVMKVKETRLDLSKDDFDYDDDLEFSLSTYYNEMIGRVLKTVSNELAKKKYFFDGPLDLVACGGTSMAPGFVDRLKKVVSETKLPFEVKDIKLASDPFFSVAQGSCLAARGDWEKAKGK